MSIDPTTPAAFQPSGLGASDFKVRPLKPLPEFETLRLIAESAAFSAGNAIRDLAGDALPTIKEDAFVGNRAIVTPSDFKSQESIFEVFERLLGDDPKYTFITEELISNPNFANRVITGDRLHILSDKIVFVIDELDGTWKHKAKHHDWSVSIGCFSSMTHVAGAIYAPKIDGGSLYSASRAGGAFLKTPSGETAIHVSGAKSLKEAAVCFGVDAVISDKFAAQSKLLQQVGNEAGQCDMCGSCALGLSLVAAGKLDALVQPPQRPWDWAAGKIIVEEAFGKVILYRQEGNRIVRLTNTQRSVERDTLDPRARSVGFVAGPEALAEELFERLVKISLA